MENYNEMNAYEKAKKRVQDIKCFYINLACYPLVIPMLIYINLTFTPHFHWFWFSIIGWGVSLVFHAVQVFDYTPFFGRNWEERKLREFIEQEELKRSIHK